MSGKSLVQSCQFCPRLESSRPQAISERPQGVSGVRCGLWTLNPNCNPQTLRLVSFRTSSLAKVGPLQLLAEAQVHRVVHTAEANSVELHGSAWRRLSDFQAFINPQGFTDSQCIEWGAKLAED